MSVDLGVRQRMKTGRRASAHSSISTAKACAANFILVGIVCLANSNASDVASVSFSIDFPNSSPEHYAISVQSDGRAHYESSGRISNDSDARDDYQTEFSFSDATRAQIFELAKAAHYFSGKVDSGNKKLAFTG